MFTFKAIVTYYFVKIYFYSFVCVLYVSVCLSLYMLMCLGVPQETRIRCWVLSSYKFTGGCESFSAVLCD